MHWATSLAIGYICTDLNYRSLLETGIKCVMYSHLIIESLFQYWGGFFYLDIFSLFIVLAFNVFVVSAVPQKVDRVRFFVHSCIWMFTWINCLWKLRGRRQSLPHLPVAMRLHQTSTIGYRGGEGVLSKVRMSTEKSNVATYIEF